MNCSLRSVDQRHLPNGWGVFGLTKPSSNLRFPRSIACLFFALILTLIVVPSDLRAQSATPTQVISLNAGWNLVSIQVGSPVTPAQFKTAMLHPDRLQQVWGYVLSGNPAIPGHWNAYRANPPVGFQSDLNLIESGRGYWVQVSQATVVTLTGSPWDGSLDLVAGWNLIGFPGAGLAADEVQDLPSVFGANLASIQQVWTHENDTKRFVGYDLAAIPALRELNQIKPGMGYWIYATQPLLIQPGPYVILPGDADASPLEPEVDFVAAQFPGLPNASEYAGTQIRKVRPGSEDAAFDLNGNGIIDTIFTQSHLKFDVGVDRKVITIGNNGTGLANWVLSNNVDWLFTAAPDGKAYPGNAGRPKTASGVVSADRDAVTLFVDTSELQPGITSGDITIYAGSLVKTIRVLVEVPTASGDWRGIASTKRVNGRAIPIGAVDLGINLFMNSETPIEKGFRAILNKDTSLLFPKDVFMNGVFYSGNQFSLTTNFEMPAGDRNVPPFDSFPAKRAAGSATPPLQHDADFDADGNGKLDVANPFPFPVRRQITLLGQRKSPDHCEGTYIESITGALPNNQPILVEGTFELNRQNFTPTKRSIFNQATTHAPILIGGTSGSLFRESTINVGSAVSIQGLTLNLGITFPDPTKLTITLIGPNGKTVVIHQNGTSLPSTLSLEQYNGLLGQGTWKIRVAWSSTAERGYFSSWDLNILGLASFSVSGKVVGDINGDNTNEPLAGTQLVLSGSNVIRQAQTAPFVISAATTSGSTTATVPSTSTLYTDMPITGNPAIPVGAKVASVVDATTFTLSAAATANSSADTTFGEAGVFKFTGLTENTYTLAYSRPGFQDRLISFFLNNANLYVHHGSTLERAQNGGGASTNAAVLTSDPVILTPLMLAGPELRAAPWIGQEDLFVRLTALIPQADLNSIGGSIVSSTWNFGDGSPTVVSTDSPNDEVANTSASHTFTNPGTYEVILNIQGPSGNLATLSRSVHVHRSTPDERPGAGDHQILVAGFVGAFAAPLNNPNVIEVAPGAGTVSQNISVRQADGQLQTVALSGVPRGVVPQESKRDSAGFDIDREPLIALPDSSDFGPSDEDSDFNGQLYVSGDGTTTFPFLFRAYDPGDDPAGDLSPGTFLPYVTPVIGGKPVPDRFRCFVTLGGTVFTGRHDSPLQSGDFALEVGRVEP